MAHAAWHDFLHLAAAAVLVGGGGIFVARAWADRGAGRGAGPGAGRGAAIQLTAEPPAALPVLLTILAAGLSVAAAAIHLAAAPAHLAELGAVGWGFVVAAAFQGAWALAYAIQPSPVIARLAVAGNLAILAAWGWSRVAGLPIGPSAGIPEAIGTPDAVAAILEAALVVVVAGRGLGLDAWLGRRLERQPDLPTVAIVPIVGVVFLATTLAVGVALRHEHGTASDAAGHPADHAAAEPASLP